ncbi:flagellar basal body-associated FliL family protein [Hahella aquimaris]|uniref:flagellar basal body-associated FliL family protein n=1 Tax=Hahella sp. HNIBRBA332 TaxID=3015983 RepID=UPI00273CBC1A|nr:flagellar basal body-associated FliL family protein [Hahella sp. HNIBRBA332]WLQ14708.1 flagellar basal body-associated FliL family protein [Hahella sp. HNIBRBA332]
MAKDNSGEGGEESGKSGGLSKKLIIIIVLVLVIAVGASVGVTMMLLKSSPDEGAPAEGGDQAAAPVKAEAIYYDMRPPLVVTFDYKGKQRFLQASISLLTRNQGVLDGVELHMPVIRNRLINLYSGKDFENVQTDEGRLALLSESLEAINTALKEQGVNGEIEQVLFTNFVLQ